MSQPRSIFGRPGVERALRLLATSGPLTQRAVAIAVGRDAGSTHALLRRLVRVGAVHIERLGTRKSLVSLDRGAVGHDVLRALLSSCPTTAPVTADNGASRHRSYRNRRQRRGEATPMDLDALFGSRVAGRALAMIRRLGGADVAELADLLGERRRPVVRRALRRFVALGVVRIAPRSGLRRPYVLAPEWPGAAALARLLDLHLDAVPHLRRRAALSARIPDGRRGRRGPRVARDRAPQGLDAAPAFAPFMPPAHAKAVALLAKRGPATTKTIAAALGVGRGCALALGAALCERRLATSAIAPFAKGIERWYGLTAAGSAIGAYLAEIVGPVRGARRRGTPPRLPRVTAANSWRAGAAMPSTPHHTALRILAALVGGPLSVDEIARRVGTQGRRVRPHLDAFVRVGLLSVAFPANVPTYAFDGRTPQGRAALALFRTR